MLRIYIQRLTKAELGLEFINKGFVEEVYGKIIAKGLQLRERANYDVYYKATKEKAEKKLLKTPKNS